MWDSKEKSLCLSLERVSLHFWEPTESMLLRGASQDTSLPVSPQRRNLYVWALAPDVLYGISKLLFTITYLPKFLRLLSGIAKF